MVELLTPLLLAFVVAVGITKLAEVVSRRRGLLDMPNDRSSHVTPTPRIGGVGIIAGATAGLLVAGGWREPESLVVLGAAGALGLVGLADDIGRRSLIGKYLAQLVSSAVVAIAFTPVLAVTVGEASLTIDGAAAAFLTVLWLTAVINAFNFVDGIDGMLGSLVVVFGVAGAGMVGPEADAPLLVAAAASLGFLVWNHAPASIFMGDVGSQFLGLWVGASLLRSPGASVEVVPLLILLGLVLFDTGLTLVRRMREGKNLFAAHREHLYQRLGASGAPHRAVAAAYAGLTAVLATIALAWTGQPLPVQVAFLLVVALACWLLLAWVRRLERSSPPT
jgi:UDP-N-acetylmuramyl pentapeptide phosphotransferase/UDP-N-acetylglucosamine-1-phosphate transferase